MRSVIHGQEKYIFAETIEVQNSTFSYLICQIANI